MPTQKQKDNKMKKYIEPKIQEVDLDPRQATLQVCMAGGVYIYEFTAGNICVGSRTLTADLCNITPKGGVATNTGVYESQEYNPS